MILQIATVVIAYLLGSIPFGLLLTRLAGTGDIRKIGSGNIGATNVLRTGNKSLAALTLLLDMLKGTVAVLLARQFAPDMAGYAALAAFLGHVFPVWLNFNGGKGVATALGVFLGLTPEVGIAAMLVWLCVAFLFRISSSSALAAIASTFLLMKPFHYQQYQWLSVMLIILTAFTHRANIKRLILGTEPKIGSHKKNAKAKSETE